MIASFNGCHPVIGKAVFIAPTAVIIGNVTIESGASIWYGTVVRGDIEPIVIGADSNVQDNCTLHTEAGQPLHIGARVSIGHQALVHGCTIEDDCLIAMGAVVLNGARVCRGSVVAAGAVVKENQVVGPQELVAGMPAVFKKKLAGPPGERFGQTVINYRQLAAAHRKLKRPLH
jgi:carbonic anhydrase/acetyltransferase-like protein (isoleucine patch superfamily)